MHIVDRADVLPTTPACPKHFCSVSTASQLLAAVVDANGEARACVFAALPRLCFPANLDNYCLIYG